MLHKSTVNYIKKKAKKEHLTIPQNYEQILEQYIEKANKLGYTLEFRKGRCLEPDSLNANAGWTPKMSIVATPEWAARLVLYNTSEIHNVFEISLGHEITHKEKRLNSFKYGVLASTFVAHVNEVYADFNGTKLMANSQKDHLIGAIQYKKQFRKNDVSNSTHPSWTNRLKYANFGVFDSDLIHEIAKDVNYSKEEVIKAVIEFFPIVELK